MSSRVGERFAVRQAPDTGIPLSVQGNPLLTLKVDYKCRLDGHDRFLAVDVSNIKVFQGAVAAGEPLFRFEYVREPDDGVPAAHLQLHAHRDALTYVMTKCGTSTTRAKRRVSSGVAPRISELHFPMGGHRFRPCLEDVLEMLISELGVDHPRSARDALREGRMVWRRFQARSVVRDSPEEAIEVLRALGYAVTLNDAAHPPQTNVRRLKGY